MSSSPAAESGSSSFGTRDLIDIITACKSAGVSEFDSGGLRLKFGVSEPRKSDPVIQEVDPVVAAKVLAEHETLLRQQQLERLRLEDPYEYEQLIIQEELTNGTESNS